MRNHRLNIVYCCHCRRVYEPFDLNYVYSFHISSVSGGSLVAVPHYHRMTDGCTVNNEFVGDSHTTCYYFDECRVTPSVRTKTNFVG